MGSGRFDHTAYASYSANTRHKSVDEVFAKSRTADAITSATGAAKHLNPFGVKVRESRDSADNPNATPIIIGVDVTGSMGEIARKLVVDGLGTLFKEILAREPVPDPAMMFMAIGDVHSDKVPLQVSQFESDNRIIDQLTDVYIEGNGGGNDSESYTLPWYFAAMHTSCDSIEKRGKKGYLFTMGDENVPPPLTRQQITKFIGDTPERDLSTAELLTMVSRSFHVFHLVVAEGSHRDRFIGSWRNVLGERALLLTDHTKMAEVIVSTIQVVEGAHVDNVAASWNGSTAVVVREAIRSLTKSEGGSSGGVVRV